MKARDIMTPKPVVVHKQDRLENVVGLMRKHNISKIPVVDDGRVLGIVSDGDVLEELGAFKNRALSPTALHVSGAMVRSFERVAPDTEVRVVLGICKREGVGLLPVCEPAQGERLVGVITKADLLPLVKSPRPLGEFMKRTLHSVEPGDRLVHARRLMLDHGIERLPVLEEGRLAGILSEMDLALALDEFKKKYPPEHQKSQIRNLFVADVMRSRVVHASPGTEAREAAALMRKEDVGGLPVVEDEDRIAGMVTRTDLIRLVP